MKKFILFFASAALCIATAVSADGCKVDGIHPKHTNDYYGDVTCKNVNKPSMNIVGTLTIDQSQINGLTHITGTILATNTIFNTITIHNQYSPGLIFLHNSTLVKGPITFVHRSGTVCVDSSSMMLGNIINGHSKNC